MRRVPIEYGDNFPVTRAESWNPTVPWRFPNHEVQPKRSAIAQLLPWLMLGLGMTLGILWMSWREAPAGSMIGPEGFLPDEKSEQMVLPPSQNHSPAGHPRRSYRLKSRLA